MHYTEQVPYSLKIYPVLLKNGELSIYGRLLMFRKKSEIATGIRCRPEDWDEENATFNPENPHSRYLLTRLREFEGKVYDSYIGIRNGGKKPNTTMMMEVITGRSEPGSPRLLKYFDDYMELMKKKGQHSEGTMVMYRKTRQYVEEFLKKKRIPTIRLNELRPAFIIQFQDYMLSTPNKQLGRPVSRTTSNKNMKNLKAVLRHAQSMELIGDLFAGFRMKWDKVRMDFLTQSEMKMLAEVELPEHLNIVRICWLFSASTGLRYSDSFNLLRSDVVEEEDGQHWISITQKKTKTALSVPLFKPAVKIMKQFEELYPNQDTVLPTLSNQHLNRSMATITEIVGIQKRVTWHTARHTHACGLIDKGADLLVASFFLGHTSTRSSEIYARVSRSKAKSVVQSMDAGIEDW